jgi:Tol biopolymer transport system component
MKARSLTALAVVGVLTLIPLGAATAAATTAKRIAYISGAGNLVTVAANGSAGSGAPLATGAGNPSISTDGQTIVYDNGASLASIGPAATSCAGVDPALSPDATDVAYETGAGVVVSALDCTDVKTFAGGTDPAWSPDGTQIAFISGQDLAVAPATGGAVTILGTTPAA